MARLMMLCSLPRTNPGTPTSIQACQWALHPDHDGRGSNRPALRESLPPVAGLGLHRGGAHPIRVLVLGPSLSGFMRRLCMAPIGGGSRGERTRLRDQMKRLFNAHIQLAYEDKQVSASVNSPVASRTGFWWNERRPGERLGWESKVELGEKFFQEIIQHSVPLDLNILKALKRSSLGIDFYLWLTYRTFTLNRPLRLSWASLYGQFGVNPAQAGENRTVQAFRADCLRELKKIKMAWPGLNYTTAKGVLILSPSKPAIVPMRVQLVEQPHKGPFQGRNCSLTTCDGFL